MDGSNDIPPTGLTVVVDPDDASLDIVFVHGFTGHPERTWKHPKGDIKTYRDEDDKPVGAPPNKLRKLFSRTRQKECYTSTYWPRDLVPDTIPNARVLTYGYDTHIRHKLAGPPVSQSGVYEIAWDFLVALDSDRQRTPSRPMLFVVHSLGGIVLKEMLRRSRGCRRGHTHLRQIYESTAAIMFFGTPHGGADPRGFLQRVAEKVVRAVGVAVNEKIVDTLLPSGERLRELRDEFGPMAEEQGWAIHSFQEQYGVPLLGGQKVVEDTSSCVNFPAAEICEHIGRNHMEMCRFTGPSDIEYKKVASSLRRMTDSIWARNQHSGSDRTILDDRKSREPDEKRKRDLVVKQREELFHSLRFGQIDARQMTIENADVETCTWLLDTPEYVDWLDVTKLGKHHGFLWIKGKAGIGKSTLMKFAHVNARKTMKDRIVISFFFNARGEDLEKSTLGAYRSLLLQLLGPLPALRCVFDSLYLSTNKITTNHKWSIESLKPLVEQAIQGLGKSSVVCFIDALDECEEYQIRDMVLFFEHVGELAVSAGIKFNVCFSSRHYPHITIRRGLSLILEGQKGHDQDITAYLDSKLRIGNSNAAEQIRTELRNKASGVFIWVVLVVRILNQEYDSGRVHVLRRRLQEIPSDLGELFRDILTRDSRNRDELILCIQWVLFSKRPLSPEELYFAIISGVELDSLSKWGPDGLSVEVIERFILSSSKGLAEITKSEFPKVQFIHESVKDFLIKENGLATIWQDLGNNFQGQSHDRLKQCCLNYMGSSIFDGIEFSQPPWGTVEEAWQRVNSPNSPDELDTESFPFLEYAVNHLLSHTDLAEGGSMSQATFLNSFPLLRWITLMNKFGGWWNDAYTNEATLLYILAERNLSNLVRIHPSVLSCFEEETERYLSPFLAALYKQNKEAVQAFIEIMAAELPPDTELHQSCVRWDPEEFFVNNRRIMKFYADHPNTFHCRTSLSCLAEFGDGVLFALALNKARQADIDSKDKEFGRTLLSLAAEAGREAVVKILLDTGKVEIDSRDSEERTPLSWAARAGEESIVKILLGTGKVEVDSRDLKGRTPLSWAAEGGKESIVKILLDTGAADPDSKDRIGITPLHYAAWLAGDSVARLLLDSR